MSSRPTAPMSVSGKPIDLKSTTISSRKDSTAARAKVTQCVPPVLTCGAERRFEKTFDRERDLGHRSRRTTAGMDCVTFWRCPNASKGFPEPRISAAGRDDTAALRLRFTRAPSMRAPFRQIRRNFGWRRLGNLLGFPSRICGAQCAVSLAVERPLHTRKVAGSNPAPRTN